MRRLIPWAQFAAFVAMHYALVYGHVPPQNQLPATFGAAALTAMTVSIVLAARFNIIDRFMNGPGRSYRLHRWLGYSVILVIIGHWLTASARGSGLVPEWSELAGDIGIYATIALIILALLSAWKRVSYHIWKRSHYLMGLVYLASVYHTFFAAIPIEFGSFLWFVLLALSMTGIYALIVVITRHFLVPQYATVTAITRLHNGIDFKAKLPEMAKPLNWIPGQFCEISVTGEDSQRHPFSICNAPGRGEMRFVITERGDFTHHLSNHLQIGQTINIHRIAGEFTPQYEPNRSQRQLWVAGGVGITPFLAAIDGMVADYGPAIELIYCHRSMSTATDVKNLLDRTSQLPQLTVHFLAEDLSGRLLKNSFPLLLKSGWQNGHLYVCGPKPLVDTACQSWRDHNGQGAIHAELFEFRDPFLGKPQSIVTSDQMPVSVSLRR